MLTQEVLGKNIEGARLKAGFTQQELADLVGLDRSSISRIETGTRGVDSILLVKIASILGVSERSLLETIQEEALYLRAPESSPNEIKQQINWVNDFLDNYEFLKELG